ncbi:LANO_0A05798g1_1 [Lachancea nothofagi CBS 11611]|uniref:LANO_0A05798g1_1 n=1 Tax=Lachancea nothofagi CBS 11611 TaxID=1266666 RepID=A0A1G4IR68_9SACH|nr:LANO_0A05798g1_1 [Lachancea nothofagi CBS 11611]
MNESPTSASMHMWAFLVPAIVVLIGLGKINRQYGIIKPLAVIGGIAVLLVLTLLKGTSSLGQTIGYCILPGIAFAAVKQSAMLSAQVQIEKNDPNFRQKFIEVTALNTFAKAIGISFGGIMATMIFTTSVKNQLVNVDFAVPTFTNIEQLIAYHAKHFDGGSSPLAKVFTKAVQNVFFAALGCSALAFVFSIFMSNKRLFVGPKPNNPTDIEQETIVVNKSHAEAEKSHDEDSTKNYVASIAPDSAAT